MTVVRGCDSQQDEDQPPDGGEGPGSDHDNLAEQPREQQYTSMDGKTGDWSYTTLPTYIDQWLGHISSSRATFGLPHNLEQSGSVGNKIIQLEFSAESGKTGVMEFIFK